MKSIVKSYAVEAAVDPFGEFFIAVVDEYGLLMDLVASLSLKGFRFNYGRIV